MATFEVQASEGWLDTGVTLVADHTKGVSIRAAGTWVQDPGWGPVEADGSKPNDSRYYPHIGVEGKKEWPYHGSGAKAGQLIGKWGEDGPPFAINKHNPISGESRADTTRTLRLMINDRSFEMDTNSGALTVTIALYDRENPNGPSQRWDRIAQRWV
ncbi:hypothetical protein ABZ119_04050 [Streptomyces sp. NPDC006288]|uniref:hypothetical protein n=1 Tax=Streptomyces sp. NPDC006288 TaxID=3156743 RepID=UPI0033BAF387